MNPKELWLKGNGGSSAYGPGGIKTLRKAIECWLKRDLESIGARVQKEAEIIVDRAGVWV